MHGGFSRRKLLLRHLCFMRIEPLCVPNKDHNQNVQDHTTSQIHDTIDLLSPHLPRPHALLLPLHLRNLHLPSVTALPSHNLQRRTHLHRSHAPSNLVLPKTVNATTRTNLVYAISQWRCSVEELELQGERREKWSFREKLRAAGKKNGSRNLNPK